MWGLGVSEGSRQREREGRRYCPLAGLGEGESRSLERERGRWVGCVCGGWSSRVSERKSK